MGEVVLVSASRRLLSKFAPNVFRDYADVSSYLFCMLFGLRQARVDGYERFIWVLVVPSDIIPNFVNYFHGSRLLLRYKFLIYYFVAQLSATVISTDMGASEPKTSRIPSCMFFSSHAFPITFSRTLSSLEAKGCLAAKNSPPSSRRLQLLN